MPGEPAITGTPVKPVPVGSTIRLVCASRGTSRDTELVWYQGGRRVDATYRIADGFVVNEYDYITTAAGLIELECRMIFPPARLSSSTSTRFDVIGLYFL